MLVANGIFNVVLMRFARRCFARDGYVQGCSEDFVIGSV
jgi:hypothetical protein